MTKVGQLVNFLEAIVWIALTTNIHGHLTKTENSPLPQKGKLHPPAKLGVSQTSMKLKILSQSEVNMETHRVQLPGKACKF